MAVADLTGNALLDVAFVQEDGKHYWFEHDPAGTFTRHTIRGTAITDAKFEGIALGDFDEDGEEEAFSADQANGDIWCHVQDTPGTPDGTWTGGIILGSRSSLQNLRVLTIDGTLALLYTWEGTSDGTGGIGALTYNGSGDITSAANWTDQTLIQHNDAWWIDDAGLVTVGGEQRLYFGARDLRNNAAVPGAFYLTKPASNALGQTWAETTIYQEDTDFLHVISGDFFGNGVDTDAAIHDQTGRVLLFDSSNDWAVTTLQSTAALARYNLINTGRQRNGRDMLLSLGQNAGGRWRWNNGSWVLDEMLISASKIDGVVPQFDVDGDGISDFLISDSVATEIFWMSGGFLS